MHDAKHCECDVSGALRLAAFGAIVLMRGCDETHFARVIRPLEIVWRSVSADLVGGDCRRSFVELVKPAHFVLSTLTAPSIGWRIFLHSYPIGR